ncbi:MAG: helix-turn-helix domain-containing protein [Brevundimonas sp.]
MILASSTGDYAIALLNKGYDVQNVSRMCRMPMESVRLFAPPRRAREEYRPRPHAAVHAKPLSTEPFGPPMPSRRDQILANIDGVALRYGLRAADLISPARDRHIAYPRHEAMSVVKERWGLSFPKIGALFGGRDHTTVLYGIQSHENRAAWCAVVEAMADVA